MIPTLLTKKLKNGLKICIEHINSDFVTIGYYVNIGAFDEPLNCLGIAHLTEHLVFKGTLNRPANIIFTEIERLGGSMNAYTTETHTVFYVTILKEYWKEAIDVLSDIIWNNTIPEEEFGREKDVVLEELKMYNDDGQRHIMDVMTKTAFINTPNKWNNGGTIQSVSAITRQDVADFIDNFYVPQNITLYVTGDLQEEDFITFVQDYTDQYSFNEEIISYRDDTKKVVISNVQEDFDATQSHLVMYFPFTFNENLHDLIITELAQDIFGNGFGSRLMEIREKYGYAYTIFCDNFLTKPDSLIYVYVGLNKNNIDKTKRLMLEKMEEIREHGITEEEFDTAYNCLKTQLKTKALFTESMNDFRISLMGNNIDCNDSSFQNIIQQIESVSLEEINAFYKNTFNPDNVGFIELLQTKSGDIHE